MARGRVPAEDDLTGPGLTARWARSWASDPSAVLLTAPAEGVRWTAGEVAERSAAAAGVLSAAGVRPGDRVLLSGAPSSSTVLAYLAVLRLGATAVPVSTTATAHEIGHVVAVAAPVAAVVDDPGRVDLPVIDLSAAGAPRTTPAPALDAASGDDTALLAFTSGTTGRPKAAVLSHDNLLAGAAAVVEAWEWAPDDVLLLALPLFHMHGLGVGVNGALTAGSGIVLLPRFDPGAVAQVCAGTSMFFGVPTMYSRLVESGAAAALSGQRLLVSGSAPLAPSLFAAVHDATGQPPLERYGMTETVMIAGNPLRGERRPGTVGVPFPRMDVRLSSSGEVEVRGPSVFHGYLGADPTGEWFATGDIGVLDDGYLRLVGRARDLIITGGVNVYPREVEEVLLTHPGVREAAVVGAPDDEWGEVVVAYVVTDEPTDVLAEHVAGLLAPYKRPRRWRVVDALPRNAMGKVQRDLL